MLHVVLKMPEKIIPRAAANKCASLIVCLLREASCGKYTRHKEITCADGDCKKKTTAQHGSQEDRQFRDLILKPEKID